MLAPLKRTVRGTIAKTTGRILPVIAAASALALTASPLLAAESEAPEHQPGLLDLDTQTMILVLVIFLIVLIILRQTAWKSVLAGLKAREERIRNDISQAELAHSKAEATLNEYNQRLAQAEHRVAELIAGARADGERLATQIRARAEQEAQETKERAIRDIESARKQALSEIYEQTATLATAVAQKILRRNLNSNDQRDLVNQSLEELQSVG